MGSATSLFVLLTTSFPLLHHRCPSLLRLSRHHKLLSPSLPSFSHFHHLTCSLSNPPHLPSSPIKAFQQFHNQSVSSLRTDYSDSWSSSPPQHSHPWLEWSRFINYIFADDYFDNQSGFDASGAQGIGGEDEFVAIGELTQLFLREARACLAFARERPNLLRLLSRRDIEVVVKHGAPFLFQNSKIPVIKMKSFISSPESSVLDTDRAHMVDLMKFMLSYASSPLVCLERDNLYNRNLVESSVRNLFSELCKLCYNALAPGGSKCSGSVQTQMPGSFGQTMPPGEKVEMKRGDWICSRCNFMNFARNLKCLKCEEARPKRQLTGGEWECPQCDFFNYGRNMTCMRCDCKRPGQISLGATNAMSGVGHGNVSNTNTSDVDSRLAANEEKAQRWFSKVSQLDGTADINSLVADEDFPEIMPLRKGVNRFVVSTRKTPLERRLANAQYKRNLANDGTSKVDDFKAGEITKSPDIPVRQSLGHPTGLIQSDNKGIVAGHNNNTGSLPSISSNSSQYRDVKGSNSSHVPFVPFPADMFAQKSENLKTGDSEKVVLYTDAGFANSGGNSQTSNMSTGQFISADKEKEQAEKSERWLKKIAERHDVSDLTSTVSDDDFPDIMPMHKGENQFVISKKKDRTLTPAYKRRLAMEQAGNTNFVPFVPFPPDYFAKKDKQQSDGENSIDRANIESSSSETAGKLPEINSVDARPGFLNADYVQGMTNVETSSRLPGKLPEVLDDANSGIHRRDCVQEIGNQDVSLESWSHDTSARSSSNGDMGAIYGVTTGGISSQSCVSSRIDNQEGMENKCSGTENKDHEPSLTGSSSVASQNQNSRERWTGLSLEGSAVKEPDPLDMSEEAKAERWFRRVSQIKDISELSQIPDEDFPSIMPMRKGVNRFVVSKRKTPLERRLTSQQYRRNLPIVSSDPIKKENEGS